MHFLGFFFRGADAIFSGTYTTVILILRYIMGARVLEDPRVEYCVFDIGAAKHGIGSLRKTAEVKELELLQALSARILRRYRLNGFFLSP